VIVTSRRLKSLIKEEERLVAKIADLQSRLEEVRKAKKMEEDAEILKSFRSMELETWDLYNLANGIKDGEISMEMLRQVMAAGPDGKDTAGDAGVSNEALNNPENTVASGPLEGGDDPNPVEMNQETADQRLADQEEMDPEEIENAPDEH